MTLAIHRLDDRTDSTVDGATPFVLVHGFTQNGACLEPFARAVDGAVNAGGGVADMLMIDAPGHGASHHDSADLIDAAHLLVEAGGEGHYVGYSMGGRILLHAALLFPERFRSLTLIGATAGIESARERAQRMVADDQLAKRLERDGVASFLDFWLGLELFATLPPEAAQREQRLTNRVEGLASSLRNCGAGNQFPLWGRLRHVDPPVLIIAGSSDAKFTEIGQRMATELPNARFESVPGGHAVHSERPEAVAELIADFSRREAAAPAEVADARPDES